MLPAGRAAELAAALNDGLELPTPTDYGRAAVFLASDDARMITGADLRVDTGTVAKHWAWIPGPVGSAG